jgi:RND family efflux transporter MFP subunit
MKKGIIVVVLIAIVIVGGIFVLNYLSPGDEPLQDAIANAESNSVPVEVVEAKKGDITEITRMTAQVEASEKVSIIPKMGGKVDRVAVSVGDRVSKGQVLIQLEQKDLLAQLKQAEAGLAAAKAGENSAIARLEDAQATLERMKKLYEEGAISKQQLEQAKLQYEVSSPEAVYAQIEQAEAAVEAIKLQLENTTITSPISGVVTSVNVSTGEMAGPSMPVAEVMNLDEVEVKIGVVEQYINNINIGDRVYVKISSVSSEPFIGTIKTIAPAADSITKTFPVTVVLDNKDHQIKVGMFAEVSIVTRTREDVIIVPMQAVVDQGGRQTVFVVENDQAVSRQVEFGLNDGKNIEIISGIAEGESVIVKGQNIVIHGDPVSVQGGEK